MSSAKNDLCHLLLKYGFVNAAVKILRCASIDATPIGSQLITKLLKVLLILSHGPNVAKEALSSPRLLKSKNFTILVLRIDKIAIMDTMENTNMSITTLILLLKSIKNISMNSGTFENLQKVNLIERYCKILSREDLTRNNVRVVF